MSKEFFRFLRGELNGFYITNLNNLMNVVSEDIKKFFLDFSKMQFDLETMSMETIYNIGTFAGVHLVRLSVGEAYGALRMTEGHIVNGVERSERGLLLRGSESFEFEHTEQDSYPDDINTLATSSKRSSFTGDEQIQGYISSDNYDVLDDNGNVKPSAILSTPPSGVAYSDFYGDSFMFLSDQVSQTENINPSLFIELYKVMQYIRYNGCNIKSFAQMVAIICPDNLVKIKSITKRAGRNAFNVTYVYDSTSTADYPAQRIGLLEYLTLLKFPQFMLIAEG